MCNKNDNVRWQNTRWLDGIAYKSAYLTNYGNQKFNSDKILNLKKKQEITFIHLTSWSDVASGNARQVNKWYAYI